MNEIVTVISNSKCWMEQCALDQLNNLAKLQGVVKIAGLPDLHAGKSPVGIAVETKDIIYPHLIGSDIGCGMGLFQTHIPMRKYKQKPFVTKLNHIRALEDIVTENPFMEESPIYDLGTIGGGNHFAEFQVVDKVFNQTAFEQLSINKDELLILIHSGSRSYGQRILSEFLDYDGIRQDDSRFKAYLEKHDDALLWARRNRQLTAEKLVHYLGFSNDMQVIIDCVHNYLEQYQHGFIHRKGAVSALSGPVIIPGSRGSLTYLAVPASDTEKSLFSLSHGAGRKWSRSLCKSRIRDKYNRDTIRTTKFKGQVVCHDTELLYQEAPEAYKNIGHIIQTLEEHGLIEVVATLRPLLTFKG